MAQPAVLCSVCTKAFSQVHLEVPSPGTEEEYYHTLDYHHHPTRDSWLNAVKIVGCQLCSVMWEQTALEYPDRDQGHSDLPLNITYSVSRFGDRVDIIFRVYCKSLIWLKLSLKPLRFISQTHQTGRGADLQRAPDRNSRCLEHCRYWLDNCLREHSLCRGSQASSSSVPVKLPTRLLDLRRLSQGIVSLRTTDGTEEGPYVTLSHRWGKRHTPHRLLQANLEAYCRSGIATSTVSATFREAMQTAVHLGAHWLWIDSLCIIQDSADDWRAESARMGNVYRNGLCNLAATGAAQDTGHQNLFPRDSPVSKELYLDIPYERVERKTGTPQGKRTERYRASPWGLWEKRIERSKLSLRGWVVQERVLSPRALHFTETEVFWECLEHTACESQPDFVEPNEHGIYGPPGHPRAIRPLLASSRQARQKPTAPEYMRDVRDAWQLLCSNYSGCQLTNESSDRLIALSGIAKVVRDITGDQYLAGLWRSSAIMDLLWHAPDPGPSPRTRPLAAPSWSWASACSSGSISYRNAVWVGLRPLAALVGYDAVPYTHDDTGQLRSATIKLSSILVPATQPSPEEAPEELPVERLPSLQIGNLQFTLNETLYDEDYADKGMPDSIAQSAAYLPLAATRWGECIVLIISVRRPPVENKEGLAAPAEPWELSDGHPLFERIGIACAVREDRNGPGVYRFLKDIMQWWEQAEKSVIAIA